VPFQLFSVRRRRHKQTKLEHTGLYAPAFAAIIGRLALRPDWTSFLEWRWLVLLGESSYCLYLLHAIIIGRFLFPNPEHTSASALPARLQTLEPIIEMVALGAELRQANSFSYQRP